MRGWVREGDAPKWWVAEAKPARPRGYPLPRNLARAIRAQARDRIGDGALPVGLGFLLPLVTAAAEAREARVGLRHR